MSNSRAAVDEISISAAFHLESTEGFFSLENVFLLRRPPSLVGLQLQPCLDLREIHQNNSGSNLI